MYFLINKVWVLITAYGLRLAAGGEIEFRLPEPLLNL
jgi:hypothetical protein